MHLLIPFAAPLSEPGRAALRELRLPRLQALLAGRQGTLDEGDEYSLSTPPERALARAWGWAGADGCLPFAARAAAADALDLGDLAWGLLTPVHWHLGTEQVSLTDPAALLLDEAESRAFYDAVAPLFTSEGFLIHWGAPLRWYLAHESLAALPTASLDRVIGRNVDRWLPGGPQARLLRRLQNEVQMLLYTHPLNAEREARGQSTVNSFWLSGCGLAQACAGATPTVDERLRPPALAEDWPGWAKAWQQIDAELAAQAPERLTLCGERSSLTYSLPPRGLISRLMSGVGRSEPAPLLERL
ncbi:MAG: hypothetical protein LCI02_11785 [Proteobacteria bacterium]|nr:hypothetical protein [Pseudomonadota bacterium]